MATGRRFENLSAEELLELKAILESYAVHCGEMVKQLAGKPFRTDGYTTVKKGIFALRNLLAKQLGQIALDDHPVVATWIFRNDGKKNAKKNVPIRLNSAAEPIGVYDISQGNPTPKEAMKVIKATRKKPEK